MENKESSENYSFEEEIRNKEEDNDIIYDDERSRKELLSNIDQR